MAFIFPSYPLGKKRYIPAAVILILILLTGFHNTDKLPQGVTTTATPPSYHHDSSATSGYNKDGGGDFFRWIDVQLRHPIARDDMAPLPDPKPNTVPRIQHIFSGKENADKKKVRLQRLEAVKANFTHAWEGYKRNAWMSDEVRPISGTAHNPFGGWAATLVDTLDTLWILNLKPEFRTAVEAISTLDFTTSTLTELNIFETTIRYLGGFLSAHDLSNHKFPILLQKAVELGDMLLVAFDTPNHMPIMRWKHREAKIPAAAAAGDGGGGGAGGGWMVAEQEAGDQVLLAEIGSLTLEFTRLSQLTGDNKYYDAVQRIMKLFEQQQDLTKLPGLWPVVLNARDKDFTAHDGFTIGGMADSAYEYLPKQFLLLAGGAPQYRDMYTKSLSVMKRHIFYRPITPYPAFLLLAGDVRSDGHTGPLDLRTEPRTQHLSCFAGGMVALGAKALGREREDMGVAKALVEGCLWGYESNPGGIMPEIMRTTVCDRMTGGGGVELEREGYGECDWNEGKWFEAIGVLHGGDDKGKGYGHSKRDNDHRDDTLDDNDARDNNNIYQARDTQQLTPENKQPPRPPAPPAPLPPQIAADENLTPGVTEWSDPKYQLRPEAIESVFLLYRITGDESLVERAWNMFVTTVGRTETGFGHAGLGDVVKGGGVRGYTHAEHGGDTGPGGRGGDGGGGVGGKQNREPEENLVDRMESFWLAETLKYFYLMFSEPGVVSLDEWVFNTEAHALRWRDGVKK